VLRLAADHNFDERIVRALVDRLPGLDVVRLREAGLAEAPDPQVLEWAADQERVLLTHDHATLPGHAYERTRRGRRMPGVVEVPPTMPLSRAVDDLVLLAECSHDGEWEGQVLYLPLQ
jgi:hypothetical protein